MSADRNQAVRELLAFYQEAGVDALVGETPVDRLAGETPVDRLAGETPVDRLAGEAPGAAPAPAPAAALAPPRFEARSEARPQASTPPRMISARDLESKGRTAVAPPSADAVVMAAREAAKSAGTLEELRAILDRFEGCGLRATASRLVFADGNPQARLLFVGEAPGRDEDIEGLPFVGRSGKLLDRMIKAIGLDRSSVYIANIVPWRPPGNREPSAQESAICLPFIRRQIELANPDVLVCLGKPAVATLLGVEDGIRRTRGRWFGYDTGTREIRALATFHPAYLLRSPLEKRFAWRDFLAVKKALDG